MSQAAASPDLTTQSANGGFANLFNQAVVQYQCAVAGMPQGLAVVNESDRDPLIDGDDATAGGRMSGDSVDIDTLLFSDSQVAKFPQQTFLHKRTLPKGLDGGFKQLINQRN